MSMGHSLPIHSAPAPNNVRYAPNSDHSMAEFVCPLSAKRRHRNCKERWRAMARRNTFNLAKNLDLQC